MKTQPISTTLLVFIGLLTSSSWACNAAGNLFATATPTPSATPIPTNTPRPTATPTETPEPTATLRPTKTDTPEPTPTEVPLLASEELGGGWTQFTVQKYGFTIQLPDNWIITDFSLETFEAVADLLKATEGGETIAALLNSLKNNPSVEPVLMAFDLDPKALRQGAAPSVNVIASRDATMANFPMDSLVALVSRQLELTYPSIQILESDTQELTTGETVGIIKYILTLEFQPGQTVEAHGHQVYMRLDDMFLILTISAPNKGFEENYAELFDRIATSFSPAP